MTSRERMVAGGKGTEKIPDPSEARSEHLARRKALYEAKHPESKHGGDRKSEAAKNQVAKSAACFADDASSKTGRSARAIRNDVRIAKALAVEVSP